jgi:hypothetical protein
MNHIVRQTEGGLGLVCFIGLSFHSTLCEQSIIVWCVGFFALQTFEQLCGEHELKGAPVSVQQRHGEAPCIAYYKAKRQEGGALLQCLYYCRAE